LRTIKSINHNNQTEEELFMSSQITTAFTQQYSNNVKLLAQEKGSQLRNTVTVESVTGKNSFFDQVGVATAQKRTTRHADF